MNKGNFTAIDFETANFKRYSICQIGIVKFENGVIVDSYSSLVKPPDNYYAYQCTKIHGIKPEDTENSLNFSEIW